MPVRTNAAAVSLIISTDLDISQIEAFIVDASVWIDSVLVPACPSATEAQLTAIEKYLTAYYITLQDPRLSSARHDDVQEAYQRDPKISEYLKIAMSYDPCGILETTLGDKRKVQFRTGEAFSPDLDLPRSSYE